MIPSFTVSEIVLCQIDVDAAGADLKVIRPPAASRWLLSFTYLDEIGDTEQD